MLRGLRDRWPSAHIVVRPVRVQGQGAAAEIAQGLADVQRLPEVEVVIVGRGGGSLEDLWAFNEEAVARAIAACRVPVVSAVGHEVDFTIADFVADVRAATPSAAAPSSCPTGASSSATRALTERLRKGPSAAPCHDRTGRPRAAAEIRGVPRADATLRIDDLDASARGARASREVGSSRAARLSAELDRHRPGAMLAAERASARHAERLRRTIERRVAAARAGLAREAARLEAFSPLACLERGYAIVRKDDASAAVVRDAATLAPGEPVRIVLARGRAKAHIDSTER
jgi:exodeoxyribonuclease VII large subunit